MRLDGRCIRIGTEEADAFFFGAADLDSHADALGWGGDEWGRYGGWESNGCCGERAGESRAGDVRRIWEGMGGEEGRFALWWVALGGIAKDEIGLLGGYLATTTRHIMSIITDNRNACVPCQLVCCPCNGTIRSIFPQLHPHPAKRAQHPILLNLRDLCILCKYAISLSLIHLYFLSLKRRAWVEFTLAFTGVVLVQR